MGNWEVPKTHIWSKLLAFLAVQNSSIGGRVTDSTFTFDIQRATPETCDLWDTWSEWWGNMTWPTFWQSPPTHPPNLPTSELHPSSRPFDAPSSPHLGTGSEFGSFTFWFYQCWSVSKAPPWWRYLKKKPIKVWNMWNVTILKMGRIANRFVKKGPIRCLTNIDLR